MGGRKALGWMLMEVDVDTGHVEFEPFHYHQHVKSE